jgi:transposase-like protein
MANATKTTTSLKVSCPFCGNDGEGGEITLDLNDLDRIVCASCDETFTAEKAANKARENADRWDRIVRWIDQAGTI